LVNQSNIFKNKDSFISIKTEFLEKSVIKDLFLNKWKLTNEFNFEKIWEAFGGHGGSWSVFLHSIFKCRI
jgi:hypothetical protein